MPTDHYQQPYEPEEQREAQRRHQVREHQRQAAREAQNRKERPRAQNALNRHHEKLTGYAQQRDAAIERGSIKEKRLATLEKEAPSFANGGPRATMGYTISLLGAMGVILVNFFLINAPINYLASIPFGGVADEEPWQAQVATAIVPIVILLVELSISIGRREAYLEYPVEEEGWHWEVRRWDLAGFVMIFVTPLMIVGSMLAAPNWWEAYNLVTSLGMIVLAGVTDALIVFGGERIYLSTAFFYFHVARWRIQRDINYFSARRRAAERGIEQVWIRYTQALNHYNEGHPSRPLTAGPFSQQTALQVNQSLGQVVIQMPRHEEQNNEPPATEEVNPPPTPPETDVATEAERDYYRNLVDNQVRWNEREVQPD